MPSSSDPFHAHAPGLESPALGALTITPADGSDLARATRALNVAQAGFLRVTMVSGDVVTLYVAAGLAFPARVRRVWQTGTTATGITGLW